MQFDSILSGIKKRGIARMRSVNENISQIMELKLLMGAGNRLGRIMKDAFQ